MKGNDVSALREFFIMMKLTPREAEIAELVSEGRSNREIGDMLFILEKTVKFHLTKVYKKLNVKSRAQLIVFAFGTAPNIDTPER